MYITFDLDKLIFTPHHFERNKCQKTKTFSIEKNKFQSGGGFTIIEFMIYIAILVIAIVGIGLILSNIFRVGARTDVIQEVNYNGRFVMQRIGRAIKESSTITIEEGGNELVLSFKELTKDPTVFDVSGGKLRIKEGGGDYIELTTSRVFVNKLIFKKIADDSVRVEMNISFFNPQHLPEYEFNSFFTSSFTKND